MSAALKMIEDAKAVSQSTRFFGLLGPSTATIRNAAAQYFSAGLLAKGEDNWVLAERAFTKAAEIADQIDDIEQWTSATRELISVYLHLNQYEHVFHIINNEFIHSVTRHYSSSLASNMILSVIESISLPLDISRPDDYMKLYTKGCELARAQDKSATLVNLMKRKAIIAASRRDYAQATSILEEIMKISSESGNELLKLAHSYHGEVLILQLAQNPTNATCDLVQARLAEHQSINSLFCKFIENIITAIRTQNHTLFDESAEFSKPLVMLREGHSTLLSHALETIRESIA